MKELQPLNQNVLIDISENSGEQKSSGGINKQLSVNTKPNVFRGEHIVHPFLYS